MRGQALEPVQYFVSYGKHLTHHLLAGHIRIHYRIALDSQRH